MFAEDGPEFRKQKTNPFWFKVFAFKESSYQDKNSLCYFNRMLNAKILDKDKHIRNFVSLLEKQLVNKTRYFFYSDERAASDIKSFGIYSGLNSITELLKKTLTARMPENNSQFTVTMLLQLVHYSITNHRLDQIFKKRLIMDLMEFPFLYLLCGILKDGGQLIHWVAHGYAIKILKLMLEEDFGKVLKEKLGMDYIMFRDQLNDFHLGMVNMYVSEIKAPGHLMCMRSKLKNSDEKLNKPGFFQKTVSVLNDQFSLVARSFSLKSQHKREAILDFNEKFIISSNEFPHDMNTFIHEFRYTYFVTYLLI